ncbi:hypothetical protein GGS21DRAFT_432379 [Xylaria nigripes]|nr:hypothetical protein GGS21DRAFT_432379 [Xylaria nigripes]
MPRSARVNEGHLAPLSTARASTRHNRNVIQRTLMIEPTIESQSFYNKIRQKTEKRCLEINAANENTLEIPSHSEFLPRSTKSDCQPSLRTLYSPAGDQNTLPGRDLISKPQRGRRRGPLDIETRTKTAFKRKFELTCDFHREKRTRCNCHDFSKLEEGYEAFLATELQRTQTVQDPPTIRHDLSTDENVLGIGEALQSTPLAYQGPEMAELAISEEFLTRAQASFSPALNLNMNSVSSVLDYLEVSSTRPSPAAAVTMRDMTRDLIAIGSTLTLYPNRWQCEFNPACGETGSLASWDSCPWTGSLPQLCVHFGQEHHPLDLATNVHWSVCTRCKAGSPGLVQEPAYSNSNICQHDSLQRWCFSTMASRSEATGGRSSLLSLPLNPSTPASSNMEQTFSYDYVNTDWFRQLAWCSASRVTDDEMNSYSYLM